MLEFNKENGQLVIGEVGYFPGFGITIMIASNISSGKLLLVAAKLYNLVRWEAKVGANAL